jgi:thioredoxin reductase (NADPH)
MSDFQFDCVIVGGGPAGLTAAVYLARFRRSVLVVDARASRARYIPTSHNCPGFPDGISGTKLLITLRRHARKFGARFKRDTVTSMRRLRGGFVLKTEKEAITARTVLIATGIVDLLPRVRGIESAIHRGIVRLCAICDGFEASGKRIAVMGPPSNVIGHAYFLRTYSDRVTAILSETGTLSRSDRARAKKYAISVIGNLGGLRLRTSDCVVSYDDEEFFFDCIYPTLGFQPKCRLAASLGARVDKQGEIIVSSRMETTVPGLYGAGDAVSGLHQISVATGHAAIAATAIHKSLSKSPES